MTSNDPSSPNDDPGSATEQDALRRLEERLDRASDAAERLISEAARAAAGAASEASKPPPAGWQAPEDKTADASRAPDVELLAGVVRSIRDLVPPELQQRLAAALRELLLALRALIDWYIERLERRRAQPAEVQDIPIL